MVSVQLTQAFVYSSVRCAAAGFQLSYGTAISSADYLRPPGARLSDQQESQPFDPLATVPGAGYRFFIPCQTVFAML